MRSWFVTRRLRPLVCLFLAVNLVGALLSSTIAQATPPSALDLHQIYIDANQYVPGDGGASNCSATLLSGSTNEEKVWNYLVSQEGLGLGAIQAAAIMGNFKAEGSTFDPTVTNSIGAHGIAQWYAGRRIGLQNFAADRGTDENDLATQLDYLKSELEGPYKASTYDPLKATNDLAEAVRIVLVNYEVPCVSTDTACISKEMGNRLPFAQDFLTRLGSGATPGSSSSTGSCSASGNFSYGKYAAMSRTDLVNLILNAPNWKPQSQNPVMDINSGVAVDNLLRLIAATLEALPGELFTASVIQTGHDCYSLSGNISNHMGGLAVDIGGAGHTQESMNNIFTWLYNNAAALGINELIFDPVPAGTSTLSHGQPFVYDDATRQQHQNHIHVSVEGPRPTSCPSSSGPQ